MTTVAANYVAAKKAADDACWILGDLALQAGKNNHQELAADTGEKINTIDKYAYVASRYEPENRFPNLTFDHHRIMAAQEDRLDWLRQAENKGWSAQELRQNLRDGSWITKPEEKEIVHVIAVTGTCPHCGQIFTRPLYDFEVTSDFFVKGTISDGD